MKKFTKKAFTLIELLIVIGIISLLAVTVLLALNPAEAQKKARDAARVKAAGTFQAALEQYLDSGSTIPAAAAVIAASPGATSSTLTATSQNCISTANFMGIDVCQYIKSVPLDPSNGQTRTVIGSATPVEMTYRVRVSGSNYEINVRQESTANASKVTGDGGDSAQWFEVFSGPNNTISVLTD